MHKHHHINISFFNDKAFENYFGSHSPAIGSRKINYRFVRNLSFRAGQKGLSYIFDSVFFQSRPPGQRGGRPQPTSQRQALAESSLARQPQNPPLPIFQNDQRVFSSQYPVSFQSDPSDVPSF